VFLQGRFTLVLFTAAAVLAVAGALWWRIFRKAGFHGALGLLMLVPLVNVAMLILFALRPWPIEGEPKRMRAGGSES